MSLSAVTKRPVRGGSTPRIMEMTGRKSHTAVGDQVPNQFEDSPNTVMGGRLGCGSVPEVVAEAFEVGGQLAGHLLMLGDARVARRG